MTSYLINNNNRKAQYRRTTIVNIDIHHHEGDVFLHHPLKRGAVFQAVPAGFLKELQVTCVVHMLVDVQMIAANFNLMMEKNIAFVVVNININYRRPAVLGDVLTVSSKLEQLNGKSGTLSQVVTLNPNGEVVADALITFVCIDLKTQKALPLEGELRAKLDQMNLR